MMEDDWLDEDTEPRTRRSMPRSIAVLALAIAPWLAVVALLVSSSRPTHPPTPAPTAAPEHEPPAHHDQQAHQPVEPAWSDILGIVELQGDWGPSGGTDVAGALAVMTARQWARTNGPGILSESADVQVESIEQIDGSLAVVTLLIGPIDSPDTLALRRLGVPIRLGDGHPRPAGPPWWLPEPTLMPGTLQLTPVDRTDELLAAGEAMVRAGYRDVEIVRLDATDSWAYRAEVLATTPGGLDASGPVLLRRHLGQFAVAGLPTDPAAPPFHGPDGR